MTKPTSMLSAKNQARMEELKAQLAELKKERQMEIGELAVKAGLELVDNDILFDMFSDVANEVSEVFEEMEKLEMLKGE
jgi:hypothetical protein